MQTAKQTARQVIEHLPEHASWDEIMYELYVQQKISKGLEAVKQDNHVSDEEARKRLSSQYAS